MSKTSVHILRISLGITFFLIGFMIFQDPLGWGGMINPQIKAFLETRLETIMIGTAFFDMAIGILLIANFYRFLTFITAILGALHLIGVLILVGIDEITVRNIGLLGGMFVVITETWQKNNKPKSVIS